MVTRFGMSEEFGLMGLETIDSEYLTARSYMNCADETSAKVDMVVKKMLEEAYAKAKELLSANKDVMHKIAAFLVKKETITGKEFMQLMDEAKKERAEAEAALRERFPEMMGEAESKAETEAGNKAETPADDAKEE